MRKNTIDPGSTAFGVVRPTTSIPAIRTTPASASRAVARAIASSCRRRTRWSYFGFGATTISAFWEAGRVPELRTNGSYVFAGDMNGDGGSGNDLIYIPRDTSEMNFVSSSRPRTAVTFTAAEQAAAFEAYIKQDKYLSKHRGEYAERGGAVPADGQAHGPERHAGHLPATSAASATRARSGSTSRTSATC